MIEFHRKWRFWLRQLEEIYFLVSRSSSAASSWCAGSLEGVISSSFQDYSQIDIDSCCTSQDLLHLQFHLLDWWMMIPTFWLRPHQRRIGGQCQSQFSFARKWRRCFLFLLWKTWYEFSLRFHRFQILQWAIARGTTCLWIKDFEGNHENIHFVACCMKYLLYLSGVSKFNFFVA